MDAPVLVGKAIAVVGLQAALSHVGDFVLVLIVVIEAAEHAIFAPPFIHPIADEMRRPESFDVREPVGTNRFPNREIGHALGREQNAIGTIAQIIVRSPLLRLIAIVFDEFFKQRNVDRVTRNERLRHNILSIIRSGFNNREISLAGFCCPYINLWSFVRAH
jgi:hypothetical protein